MAGCDEKKKGRETGLDIEERLCRSGLAWVRISGARIGMTGRQKLQKECEINNNKQIFCGFSLLVLSTAAVISPSTISVAHEI